MARTPKQDSNTKNNGSGANLGFEAKLWAAADALRNNMDAAEYKHVVLGLIFLKYIPDAFEAKHAELAAQTAQGADPEDPDEYRAVSIFWVPPERRVTPTAGDVVFSYETRLGQAAIIPNKLKCCLGRRMGLLRAKAGKAEGNVLLRAYLGDRFQETIRQTTIHGSTVDRIPLKDMSRFAIRLPQGEALKRLAAQLSPMRSMVEHNGRNSQTLAALRDTLLPKLISGELRVKDAEKMAEAACA